MSAHIDLNTQNVTISIPKKDLLSFVFDDPPVPLDKVQYIDADDENNKLTYGGALSLLRKYGHGFRELGLKPGDVVLCFSPNQMLYPVAVYGIICAGGIFTGANPTYLPSELAHQIRHSGARYILVDPALMPVALDAASQAGFNKKNILTFAPLSGYKSLEDLSKSGKELSWERITDERVLKDRTVIILYSSGTTGLPKGVELTHSNVVSNTCQSQWMKEQGDKALEKMGQPVMEGPYIGHLPMFHAYGLMQAGHQGFRNGSTFIITRKFDLPQLLGIIQRHRVQALNTVPPVITLLAKHPIVSKFDLSSLRSIGSGAAPLGLEIQKTLRDRIGTGKVRFQQGWGMSETTCTGTTFTQADDDQEGSIGRLLPGTQAKLVDESGNIVTKPGDPGELCIRGPQVMKGYLNNPTATRETIIDGWLHTGDVAVQSADLQRFWIVDRKKELIKTKGLQVAPAELEALLLSHPKVSDAAVIGVPDERAGELPYAFIASSAPTKETKEEVMAFMKTKTAKFKWLSAIEFIEVIPKSPSGKILRRELREKVKSKAKI